MSYLKNIIQFFRDFLDLSIVTVGSVHLTVGVILYILFFVLLLFTLSKMLQKWIVRLLLEHYSVEEGTTMAFSMLVRYIIIFIGFIVILQSTGVDLSSLTVLAGALGIGVGFGLQSIASNIVSGLIILFERPIKVGDRIEIGTIAGDVVRITLRSTIVRTNDHIDIIVPNSEFITSRVINWSYTNRNVRFSFPVGVSYSTNPETVMHLLMEAADEHPGVLKTPKPEVVFKEFGESSLNFNLRVWSREYIAKPTTLRSELNISIWEKFKANGIEIPFPQRDIHIRHDSIDEKPLLGKKKRKQNKKR